MPPLLFVLDEDDEALFKNSPGEAKILAMALPRVLGEMDALVVLLRVVILRVVVAVASPSPAAAAVLLSSLIGVILLLFLGDDDDDDDPLPLDPYARFTL